ncbi:MAG: AAA family ATPase [Verrucomicrobiota bacterium]
MRTLEKIAIKGFKSIRDQTLELDRLNVFIGGNGVGKSNLIGVFRFLHEVINQRLEKYVVTRGGADNILHFGRKTTPRMEFTLQFDDEEATTTYQLRIDGTTESGLVIAWEFPYTNAKDAGTWYSAAVGYVAGDESYNEPGANRIGRYARESTLLNDNRTAAIQVVQSLSECRVYHFHDTSDTAAMKGVCDLEDNRVLRPEAENLAAFLYYLQQKKPDHFSLIQDTIQQIAPFFGGFQLEPSRLNESKIRLEWRENGHDGYFNATSLSDGTLRFICLATLLLQPELPTLLLLDEPELGLHPAAVALLADLLAAAAEKTQVLVATQSVTLINHLTPEQVWTVNRKGDQSVFTKLDQTDYSAWLDDYALGELWEKNLITARP